MIQQFKIEPENVAFVGDTSSDTSLAKLVGLPIAYNSQSEELNKVSRYNLKYGELEIAYRFFSELKKLCPTHFSVTYLLSDTILTTKFPLA